MKLILIILTLIGVLLISLSMYFVPYFERYKSLELPFFIVGVFLLLVVLLLLTKFVKLF
ncbi:Uncharacterised protein [Streptococcus acidominimus]|uniref:Uncharacterized protein n=1 Tax=Streptococcus acidominimus TaxID=1326 RepID=A0A239XBC9_STRAI|nr:Uncharacterised protein [Streptococcus acidominimus]